MITCPSCHRHVRPTETACPFCAGALETTMGGPKQQCTAPSVMRLDRIALEIGLAVLTVGGLALTGCTDPEPGPDEISTEQPDAAAAEYGGPDTSWMEEGDGDPGDGDPGDGDPGDGDPGDGDPGDGDGDGDGDPTGTGTN